MTTLCEKMAMCRQVDLVLIRQNVMNKYAGTVLNRENNITGAKHDLLLSAKIVQNYREDTKRGKWVQSCAVENLMQLQIMDFRQGLSASYRDKRHIHQHAPFKVCKVQRIFKGSTSTNDVHSNTLI